MNGPERPARAEAPRSTLDQAPEGGVRFPVDARLDGRTFVTFHVDLGLGDEVLDPLERPVPEGPR